MTAKRVLVLGGYGNFGKRICENLSRECNLVLIVSGRNLDSAKALKQQLDSSGKAVIECACIDLTAPSFTAQLIALAPDIVIHTAGPFQGQNYSVPKACIDAGSHYIDLSDDRRFVCDIGDLNRQAEEKGVLLVTGASSVPGVSSAVVQEFSDQFLHIDSIDIAISPGNKAERGLATLKGVLSYTGHAIPVFESGRWVTRYGWMSARRWGFGADIGRRWLANVDVPDLELFPKHFKVRDRVRIQAGLELSFLHLAMVAMAQLSKWGLVKDWSTFTDAIFKMSHCFDAFGSDLGGMRIELKGVGQDSQPKTVNWVLSAAHGFGPYIPTLAAIVITKKLIASELHRVGATPCVGLFNLKEFDSEARPLGITHGLDDSCG